MTHWSKTTGTIALGSMYLIQASMIIWGPPPVKAFGLAWAVIPMMDPFVFGLGYAAGSGIGHDEGEISKYDVFTGLVSVFEEPKCNPFDPDWSKRCLKVQPLI
jgi:hypothetical protein